MATIVASIPSYANRLATLEALHELLVIIILYIDDVLAPTGSVDQTARVFQAFEEFTNTVGSRFNLGPSKTAIMGPVGHATSDHHHIDIKYFGEKVPTVDLYTYLGVTLDCALSFHQHLAGLIAKGWSVFNELRGAAHANNFTICQQA